MGHQLLGTSVAGGGGWHSLILPTPPRSISYRSLTHKGSGEPRLFSTPAPKTVSSKMPEEKEA